MSGLDVCGCNENEDGTPCSCCCQLLKDNINWEKAGAKNSTGTGGSQPTGTHFRQGTQLPLQIFGSQMNVLTITVGRRVRQLAPTQQHKLHRKPFTCRTSSTSGQRQPYLLSLINFEFKRKQLRVSFVGIITERLQTTSTAINR